MRLLAGLCVMVSLLTAVSAQTIIPKTTPSVVPEAQTVIPNTIPPERSQSAASPAPQDEVQIALGYAKESKFDWAFPIFKKHAEAGNLEAMYHLGIMYHYGEGMKPDQKTAVMWMSRAANAGYAPAQNDLGIYLDFGDGVKADKKLAVRWYQASAQQGYKLGQRNLALSYLHGVGVPKNQKLALEWFEKAANQDDDKSALSLGKMYELGQGTTKDFRAAFRWYGRAALSSNWPAQLSLAKLYLEGRGTERDLVKAHVWFTSAKGEDGTRVSFNTGKTGIEAEKFLQKLNKEMSAAQIEQAKSLLRTCHAERNVERALAACGLNASAD